VILKTFLLEKTALIKKGTSMSLTFDPASIPGVIVRTRSDDDGSPRPTLMSPDSIGSLPAFDYLNARQFNETLNLFAKTGNLVALRVLRASRSIAPRPLNEAVITALANHHLDLASELMSEEVGSEARGWYVIYAADAGFINLIKTHLPILSMIPKDFLASARAKAKAKGYAEIVEYLTEKPLARSCCAIQ
jgi:hypothetical protein